MSASCQYYAVNELISILFRNKKEKLSEATISIDGFFMKNDVYQHMSIANSIF